MGWGGIESLVFRAVQRVLGEEAGANAMAEVTSALPAGRWPEDAALGLEIVRGVLFDTVVALEDREAASRVVGEVELALHEHGRAVRDRKETPRAPTKAASGSPEPTPSYAPASSGARLKPHLQLLVVTRDFSQVSLLSRLLPSGRALLVTKPTAFAGHLDRPGFASIVVYDAREPVMDAAALCAALQAESAPMSLVVWGAEHLPADRLASFAAICVRVATVPAAASATAVLRVCLDLVAGASSAAGSLPPRR